MNDFLQVVRTRRSANKFIEGIQIPEADFAKIFDELSLAPSAFNLQHARYHVAQSEEKIEALYEASFKQHKVKTASATIIVTGDKNAYQEAGKIYDGSLMLGILQPFEYNAMIDMINNLYEGWGDSFKHDEAVRNASLSAMLFMLVAKNYGWDTCPMIYFDKQKVADALGLPENEVPVLMITMGKSNEDSKRIRGFRKPTREIVKFY